MAKIQLIPCWKEHLKDEFKKPYMQELRNFLISEKQKGIRIFPASNNIFSALNETPFDKVKVVILGQDPYHGPNQAHGMCFSVLPPVPPPPSLLNIFKELKNDLNINPPNHGLLKDWAHEGVLLLNNVLTVRMAQAGSHQKRGWEQFTDAIIKKLNDKRENLVFILWGRQAQTKCSVVDPKKHFVIRSVHPSPLSAHRGFLGSAPFSKTNNYLKAHAIPPINWEISALL